MTDLPDGAGGQRTLIAKWRKEAAEWQHGIGDNQNTRMLTEHADELEAALLAAPLPLSTETRSEEEQPNREEAIGWLECEARVADDLVVGTKRRSNRTEIRERRAMMLNAIRLLLCAPPSPGQSPRDAGYIEGYSQGGTDLARGVVGHDRSGPPFGQACSCNVHGDDGRRLCPVHPAGQGAREALEPLMGRLKELENWNHTKYVDLKADAGSFYEAEHYERGADCSERAEKHRMASVAIEQVFASPPATEAATLRSSLQAIIAEMHAKALRPDERPGNNIWAWRIDDWADRLAALAADQPATPEKP